MPSPFYPDPREFEDGREDDYRGRADRNEVVDVKNVDILHETEKALLIDREDLDEPVWIPLSQIDSIHRSPKPFESWIVVKKWIAKQRGLI